MARTRPRRIWRGWRWSWWASAANGDIDLADFAAKAEAAGDRLARRMITYPSTHGVFEETVREVCRITHAHGGQVYLDGANLNAMVGCRGPATSARMSAT
jgi:glycine dehydrogenase